MTIWNPALVAFEGQLNETMDEFGTELVEFLELGPELDRNAEVDIADILERGDEMYQAVNVVTPGLFHVLFLNSGDSWSARFILDGEVEAPIFEETETEVFRSPMEERDEAVLEWAIQRMKYRFWTLSAGLQDRAPEFSTLMREQLDYLNRIPGYPTFPSS